MLKPMIVLCLTLWFSAANLAAQSLSPAQVVQKQLDAYNNRDLAAFAAVFADSVKIYNFPNNLRYEGMEDLRKVYGKMFRELEDLHCTVVNRMVMDNTVIDHEKVLIRRGEPLLELLTIYKIAHEKIVEVYFIRQDK